MNFGCIFFGVLFMSAGLLFREGKLHIYLQAWKNMPQQEKDKIKVKELCVNIGTMILICGMVFLMAGVSQRFKDQFFVWDMIVWLIASGIDVYYIEKSGRYSRS